jgi:hypothetical protein
MIGRVLPCLQACRNSASCISDVMISLGASLLPATNSTVHYSKATVNSPMDTAATLDSLASATDSLEATIPVHALQLQRLSQ